MAGILDTAGDIGDVLAAYERDRARGRVDTAQINQNQARTAGDLYRTQASVALNGPRSSAENAAFGDTLANVQPFKWTGGTQQVGNIPVPQFSGGLTPANFGPATRKAGSDLATLSANRVSSPAFNLPNAPRLAPLPNASGLDSVLGTASTLSTLAKVLGGGNKPSTSPGQPGSGGGGNLADLWKLLHPGETDPGSPQHQEESDPNRASVSTDYNFDNDPNLGGGGGQNGGGIDWTDPSYWETGGAPPEDPFGLEPSDLWGG